jgi:uncharacterized membrane protein
VILFADSSAWLAVFGRAHVVLLHAPLALVPAIALLEFGALLLRRPVPRGPVQALAWFAALAGALAATSGLVLAGEGGFDADLLGWHKLAGIALGAICVLTGFATLLQKRAPLRVLVVAGLAVLVPAGHLGGSMTHGESFLFAPLHPRTPKPAPPPPNGATPTAPASEFERTVQPILQSRCTGCHNPEKKKGKLVLTTPEGIRAGGENGPVIVPGKPDASPLVQNCELALDDDDHMPPKGKPQPTPEQVAALRAWVAAGAPF